MRSPLSRATLIAIRDALANGASRRQVVQELGVSGGSVARVARGFLSPDRVKEAPQQLEHFRGTQEDFLRALPDDPEQYRDILHLSPFFWTRGQPSPSRAQAVIMATRLRPDGSHVYNDADIAARTGMTPSSIKVLLSNARAAPFNLPIPQRLTGIGGLNAPIGGELSLRMLQAAERQLRTRNSVDLTELSEALGYPRNRASNLLNQMAAGNSRVPEDLRQRAVAVLNANPRRRKTYKSFFGPLVGGLSMQQALADYLGGDDSGG